MQSSDIITLPSDWQQSFDVLPTGLAWHINPTKPYLLAAAQHLVGLNSSVQWAWADLLSQAIDLDGTKPSDAYALCAGQHPANLEEKTLQNYVVTARRWSPDRRRSGPGAYFSHHEALNPLTDAEQDHLLDISQADLLTVRRLRDKRAELYPQYGRFKPQQPTLDQLAEEQQRAARLEQALYEQQQKADELQQRVDQLEDTVDQLGINLDTLTTTTTPLAVIRQLLGDVMLEGDSLTALLPPPDPQYILFFAGDRLGAIQAGGDSVHWYDDDDPVAMWLRWRFLEKATDSDRQRFLAQ